MNIVCVLVKIFLQDLFVFTFEQQLSEASAAMFVQPHWLDLLLPSGGCTEGLEQFDSSETNGVRAQAARSSSVMILIFIAFITVSVILVRCIHFHTIGKTKRPHLCLAIRTHSVAALFMEINECSLKFK